MKTSLSMVIPALNEEVALEPTVEMVVRGISQRFEDYELLIINDGSRDKTGEIADRLAALNNHIRVIHHAQNMGLGYNYREGIELATKEYIGWIPGDSGGLTSEEDLANIFDAVGQADMVLIYLLSENRPLYRQIISQTYTAILNLLFGLKLKYFNGANIYKSELVKQVQMSTNGYGLFAEILIQLVKAGYSYVEVGMHNRERVSGNSRAFRLKNFSRVGKVMLRLYWEVQIAGVFKGPEHRKHVIKVERQSG